MPRGGPRPGAGRKPGPQSDLKKRVERRIETIKKKAIINATAEQIGAAAQDIVASVVAPPRKAGQKSAVEIMREVSNALYAMAAKYQPRKDEAGVQQGDENKFRAFASDAASVAGKLAPFEGPTYSSVRMIPPAVDLSKLTTEQLRVYEQLTAIAATELDRDQGGDRSSIH